MCKKNFLNRHASPLLKKNVFPSDILLQIISADRNDCKHLDKPAGRVAIQEGVQKCLFKRTTVSFVREQDAKTQRKC